MKQIVCEFISFPGKATTSSTILSRSHTRYIGLLCVCFSFPSCCFFSLLSLQFSVALFLCFTCFFLFLLLLKHRITRTFICLHLTFHWFVSCLCVFFYCLFFNISPLFYSAPSLLCLWLIKVVSVLIVSFGKFALVGGKMKQNSLTGVFMHFYCNIIFIFTVVFRYHLFNIKFDFLPLFSYLLQQEWNWFFDFKFAERRVWKENNLTEKLEIMVCWFMPILVCFDFVSPIVFLLLCFCVCVFQWFILNCVCWVCILNV